jgi:hypothetical protein
MPKRIKSGLILIVLLTLSGWRTVQGAVIEDLFDAKIEVLSQSEKNQSNAFKQALRQVLVKVRGNRDILDVPQIKRAISKASLLVRSFQYERQQTQLYIIINFDPKRIEDVIRNAGFPIWGKRRPYSLIWLAIDEPEGLGRQIVTTEKFPLLFEQITQQAAQRGIEVLSPIWDLDDRQKLSFYDIWGGFVQQILGASERYGVNSVLSARIYTDDSIKETLQGQKVIPKTWIADWTIINDKKRFTGQLIADNPNLLSKQLIDTLADQLSLKYAVDFSLKNPTDPKIQIVIRNMDSIDYYVKILKFLDNLSVVNNATLIRQEGLQATFELDLLGDVNDLKTVLDLDKNIQSVVDDFGQPIEELEFFWVK